MKQDLFENTQQSEIIVACTIKEEKFYPRYVSPLGIRHFLGPCRIGPSSGINGILFGHTGKARLGDGPELIAPFLAPIDQLAYIDAQTEGWLVCYRPEAINQSFISWPDLPPGIENDPYATRDRELLESALPKSDESGSRYLNLSPDEDYFIGKLFSNMTDLLDNKRDIYWPCRSRSFFLEVLLFFWQRPAAQDSGAQRSKAYRIHEWLRLHYGERVSLADLSKRFNSNRTSLQEEFRREYDNSIMDVLGQIRIDAATELMRNTQLSLSEISERTGFGDYSNFYREFRRRKNATPIDYRKQIATVRIY